MLSLHSSGGKIIADRKFREQTETSRINKRIV